MSTSGSTTGSTSGSTSGSNAGAGGFYPGLAGFMGLELSEDVLRANMPEYLPENQVALRQSVRKVLNLYLISLSAIELLRLIKKTIHSKR